jgi:hypothetical protein
MKVVRQNELTCVATFTPVDGSTATPSSARAKLVFTNLQGEKQTDTVTMTLQSDGKTWKGVWDSTVAKPGLVEWAITCAGGLKAASEGSFYVVANEANLAS